jgi:Tn3 transposase DDE domain
MIGLRKMMRISHPINEAELEHTVNWHFSVDGLQAASDRVLQLTDRLELPNLSRRSPDRLHTSSDGQKFEVRADSLNANYSYKYFGKGQGVSVYSFRELHWLAIKPTALDDGCTTQNTAGGLSCQQKASSLNPSASASSRSPDG